MWSELCEETEVKKEEGGEGGEKKKKRKWGCPVGATRGMKNSVHVSSLFPMKSCRPRNLCPTKHALALEVLSRRDLHYERSLMKEWLKGA